MHPICEPLVVNFVPTGMVPTRAMSPSVPLQPDEIIRDVVAAAEVGITIVHLHARDDSGQPTHRKDVYARIIAGIREQVPDLVICVSTSGRKAKRFEERAEPLELKGDVKPDMASLTLSSLNFPRQASVNAPETIAALAGRMRDRGIVPELEIFDLGMVNVLHYLLSRGVLQPPLYANLLFGNLAGAQADLLEIGAVASRLPAGTIWSLAGIGAAQLPMSGIAVAAAPGVRVGLEDNLWFDSERTRLATNLQLVQRVHHVAHALNRPVMDAAEFRRRFFHVDHGIRLARAA